MLKHICFANEKMKAEKHAFIQTRKNTSFSEYLRFFVFINEKCIKSASATEGGGGAIKFSAEKMVNRSTWAKR